MLEYGVAANRIETVKSATDSERFRDRDHPKSRSALREALALPESAILIGNASALSKQKGYETLIAALPRVLAENPKLDIHCLIAGTGSSEDSLRALVAEKSLDQRVHFMGFLSDVDAFSPRLRHSLRSLK